MLALILCGEFLLLFLCSLDFSVGSFSYTSHAFLFCFFNLGSFSYTSRAGFIFIWGVSLIHPMLAFLFSVGEFLLQIPCWLYFSVVTFPYISHADFVIMWGVSLTHPVLPSVLCREFLLHILSWLHFYASFLTHHVLALLLLLFFFFFFFFFLIWGFLLHIPCWLYFSVGSFSYTPHACFIFIWGVSLTHPVLASYSCGEFLLHIPYWLYFLSGEFLLHIPCLLLLILFICGEFLLDIPCWLYFYLGNFSYTFRAGFIFSGEFLLHIPCWLFDVGSFSYMFPGGWWLLYVGIFSYTSHGCAYHTNCL